MHPVMLFTPRGQRARRLRTIGDMLGSSVDGTGTDPGVWDPFGTDTSGSASSGSDLTSGDGGTSNLLGPGGSDPSYTGGGGSGGGGGYVPSSPTVDPSVQPGDTSGSWPWWYYGLGVAAAGAVVLVVAKKKRR